VVHSEKLAQPGANANDKSMARTVRDLLEARDAAVSNAHLAG